MPCKTPAERASRACVRVCVLMAPNLEWKTGCYFWQRYALSCCRNALFLSLSLYLTLPLRCFRFAADFSSRFTTILEEFYDFSFAPLFLLFVAFSLILNDFRFWVSTGNLCLCFSFGSFKWRCGYSLTMCACACCVVVYACVRILDISGNRNVRRKTVVTLHPLSKNMCAHCSVYTRTRFKIKTVHLYI